MAAEWIPLLKGHADLIQNLVQEVPRALACPSLSLEQATRLHAVIEKGVRDFDELLQIMDQADVDEEYREAAESLAHTWHLQNEAEDKVRSMSESGPSPDRVREDDVSAELNDNDEEDWVDIDHRDKT